ncbi:bifunctional phosphoribosylaminoimidazolecarboxamide formyltransferase/IMP cyclohydrolase [Candidatus Parvarchaeota archaeon]|nr:bifunctional phosphoribosylaminoimidazolecarboxamide formyltransferase/IMP cyclohydrolase [Candidatus Parvarchaeota archaeon]
MCPSTNNPLSLGTGAKNGPGSPDADSGTKAAKATGCRIKRALISVFDKRGAVEFASGLARLGVEIVSSGGTARQLLQAGIRAVEVSSLTGWPEMFEGRVKTMHPKIHGGILYRRGVENDEAQAQKNLIPQIDLVAVNLYPFEQVTGKQDVSIDVALENIDIGGPALLRAGAKNHKDVVVAVDPRDYPGILEQLEKNGDVGAQMRAELAIKAFERTSSYDAAICRYLSGLSDTDMYPDFLEMRFARAYPLRYGENPSQKAAAYRILGMTSIFDSKIHAGSKAMSYNNFLDADSAFGLIREFKDEIATVILKHNNPCGGACAETLEESYVKAHACDPESAFGGVIAFSRKVDAKTAAAIGSKYIEVVLAPGYEAEAVEILKQKESRRIMDVSNIWDMSTQRAVNFRYITGGMLYQGRDPGIYDKAAAKVVTSKKPTDAQLEDAYFATKFAKHTKSNAISIAKDLQLVGNGAGQMSRVDSCSIAVEKARRFGFELDGTTAASDAFFPFRDAVDALAKAGVGCIVQPGGSVRDTEVIAAAEEYGIAMILTGRRHFKH